MIQAYHPKTQKAEVEVGWGGGKLGPTGLQIKVYLKPTSQLWLSNTDPLARLSSPDGLDIMPGSWIA